MQEMVAVALFFFDSIKSWVWTTLDRYVSVIAPEISPPLSKHHFFLNFDGSLVTETFGNIYLEFLSKLLSHRTINGVNLGLDVKWSTLDLTQNEVRAIDTFKLTLINAEKVFGFIG